MTITLPAQQRRARAAATPPRSTTPLRLCAVGAAVAAAVLLSGCETTNMRMGSADAKTVATGSAAGGASTGASDSLERCESPLGTVSLIGPVAMDYATTIGVVREAAAQLSRFVEDVYDAA